MICKFKWTWYLNVACKSNCKSKSVPFVSVEITGSVSSLDAVQCFWEVTKKEPGAMIIIQKKRAISSTDKDPTKRLV